MARPNLLPNARSSLKIPKGLSKLQRLSYDALLLLIVSDLGVARQGKVFAKRMALEAVVGHDASQIGMAYEKDAVEIMDFAFIPIRTVKEARDAWHRG